MFTIWIWGMLQIGCYFSMDSKGNNWQDSLTILCFFFIFDSLIMFWICMNYKKNIKSKLMMHNCCETIRAHWALTAYLTQSVTIKMGGGI